MLKDFLYLKATSVEETVKLLLDYNGKAKIFNGGTDMIVRMTENIENPEALIDIKGIENLDKITFDQTKGLSIGACVTMNELSANSDILERYRIIAESAHTVGSHQVRNRATMAGNITNASPLADTATALLVLDAVIKATGNGAKKEISIHDFFKGVKKTCLEESDVVTEILVPAFNNPVTGIYQKHARRDEVDLATVCSSVVKVDGEIRIAFGSVAPTPVRLFKTEEFLKGKDLNQETIEEACNLALSEVSPIGDIRASKEYREDLIKISVKRGLEYFK